MASQISPGVVIRELDFSQYAERVTSSIFGVVGVAQKGPVNKVTTVTNEQQLISTFGKPYNMTSGNYTIAKSVVHAGIHYLRFGNQLKVVRISEGDGVASSYTFNDDNTDPAIIVTAIYLDDDDPNGYVNNTGLWGNNIKIRIEEGSLVDYAGTGGSDAGYFKLTVLYDDIVQEVFDNLIVAIGDDPTKLDVNYIETRINGVSQYIKAVDQDNNRPSDTAAGTDVALAGGDNADDVDDADYGGTITGTQRTGLKIFRDTDLVDVNILACPGVNNIVAAGPAESRSVELELISVCEARGDCIAILDPPFGKDVDTVQNFANATGGTYSGNSFNSSHAALYWSWIKYSDSYTSTHVWTPPSGWLAGVYAYNDRVTDPWYAPAGLNRGLLKSALAIEYSPNLGERDKLYGTNQVVNPIVNFPYDGITVWGQKTTQRSASSLNRVNVRRMLLYAEKVIASSVRYLLFEPNESNTWRRFKGLIQPVLDGIKSRRGLYDFRVICDETTNTAELINQNQMRGLLLLQPMKTAEIITVDFVLLATGASFEEFVNV